MDFFGNFEPKKKMNKNNLPMKTLVVIGAIIVFFIAFGNSIFTTIQPGHASVVFKRFSGGIDEKLVLESGFHTKMPWNKFIVYDIRLQELEERADVLSKNGLKIVVDVSIRFKIEKENIGKLHNQIGKEYTKNVLIPVVRSVGRSVIGRYLPDELYSTKRDIIQNEILAETSELLEKKFITIDAVLIRSVTLPETLQQAIETKLKQEQEFLEYEFKLKKAKQEAERLRVEAEGKANANRILSSSLTDKILRDKGIEATIKLSESENTKVIVIGNTKDGLPLILGDK